MSLNLKCETDSRLIDRYREKICRIMPMRYSRISSSSVVPSVSLDWLHLSRFHLNLHYIWLWLSVKISPIRSNRKHRLTNYRVLVSACKQSTSLQNLHRKNDKIKVSFHKKEMMISIMNLVNQSDIFYLRRAAM